MLNNNNNDGNKRIFLATILSTVCIVAWMKYYARNIPYNEKQQNQIQEDKNSNIKLDINDNSVPISSDIDIQNKIQLLSENNNKMAIETDKIKGSINLKGLILNSLVLKDYFKDVNSKENVRILYANNENDFYFIGFNWESQNTNIELPNNETIWSCNSDRLTIDNPIILTYKNKQNIVFQLTISIDKNYMFTIEQAIINNSKDIISFNINNKIYKKNIELSERAMVHEGFVGVFNKKLEEIKFNKLKKKEFSFQNGFNWAGLTDKYWLVSFGGDFDDLKLFNVKTSFKDNTYVMSYVGDKNIINPNDSFKKTFYLFGGPKVLDLLDNYSNEKGLYLFDRSLDFGNFYFLSKPLYILLKLFNNFLKNFGVSILFLTFFIKFVLMYPLTKKSFISMAMMKKIQPKIENLKKTYSNDKIRMNRELVSLYQKEGINPFSGCLPTLLQIPVFFSLYKVLVISIDMRHAKFFGFIKDLSSQDPTNIWNLFGLLPYEVNFFQIGLLPCLMSLSLWWQQKLSNNSMSTSQEAQMATKFMPVMFLLIFSKMPSGLLLYWIFSNIISISQQYYIEKKYLNKKVVKK